ncbi:MAG TPA: sigma factor-like helix-turn-helix DNA-binding protein, partial [Gemmatimonadales bacterium]|nr:sigma factor-like helix-turn-helix DNA-binding protein [Gemmatimonadales bacterium]
MPTLDSLPADRRAIIELVLRQAKPYGEIAGMLDMPDSRVRAYARESLGELAPRSAQRVDPAWRDKVADYLLGQLEGADADAARAHIAASEPARTWSHSVIDSLG